MQTKPSQNNHSDPTVYEGTSINAINKLYILPIARVSFLLNDKLSKLNRQKLSL